MFTPESLENRRLLSVNLALDETTGHLQIYGVEEANNLHITLYNTEQPIFGKRANLPVQETPFGALLRGVSVYDNGVLVFNNLMGKTPRIVRSVDVYGGYGMDHLSTYAWNSQVATRVFAGEGGDTIFATAHKAALPETYSEGGDDVINVTFSDSAQFNVINAGAGDDKIQATGTPVYDYMPTASAQTGDTMNSTVQARQIFAGEGDDSVNLVMNFGEATGFGYLVFGGTGNDLIVGSDKADQLYGDEGNDQIFAGAGNDYLNGGLDNDWICGQDGDDFLDHGGGYDTIDGGAGNDQARYGRGDLILDVEDATEG